MNYKINTFGCAAVLSVLGWVALGLAQQTVSPSGEVARYTFGQTRVALSAIEAEMRAAKPGQFAALEAKLLGLIQSADSTPDCKDWACRQLRFVGSDKSLETLSGLLADKDLAPVARQALLTMPSKNVEKVLRDGVAKVDGTLKAGLIQTIGERRDEVAVELLAAEIGSKDVSIAESAVEALGRIGGGAAYKALKKAVVGDSLKVCRARALLECAARMAGDGKAKKAAGIYVEVLNTCDSEALKAVALRGVLSTDLKKAFPLVESVLKSDSAKLRTIAAASLCEYGEAEMIRSVFAKLPAQPADVRVTLMSVVKDKAVITAIIEAAGGSDEVVCIAALNAIGRMGDVSTVPLLLKLATGEQGALQSAARGALQRIADKGVGAVLLSNSKNGESAIRVEAIKALKARADSSATAGLLGLVDDSDKAVRAEVFGAMAELAGASNLPAILKLLQSAGPEKAAPVEQLLTAVCRRLPDGNATVSTVSDAMAGSNAQVKSSLLRVLPKIKSEKALAMLKSCVGDADATVKDAAIRGIAEWPDASAVTDLLTISGKAESQVHRIVALRGAIRMIGLKSARPAEQTVKLLADAMSLASTADGKKLVLAALGEIKHKSALDLAVSASSDKDVQVEAVAAVKKIAKNIGERSPAAIEALKKIGEPVVAPPAGSQVTPANLDNMVNIASGSAEGQVPGGKCRVLIFSGSNNHDWKTTTPELKRILEESGLFTVDVTDAPAEIQPDSLVKYQALISNWNTFGMQKPVAWPQPLKDAFTNFIQQGGGFVVMHAGSSVLYDWPDFQRLAGASWGKGTGHGSKHKFQVKIADKENPITAGVADFETTDELWHRIATNNVLHVLATAFSAKDKGGSGQDEPVAFTTRWGGGRCFNIVLGHDTRAMASSGFRKLIVRGTEWAATGNVIEKAAAVAGFAWKQTEKSIALLNNGKVVWQLNYDKAEGKPYFHPLATVEGDVLTWLRPEDHPWHRALWFSWKRINGRNYWEEDRNTGKSSGYTDLADIKVTTATDFSARIEMKLSYHPPEKEEVLAESRVIELSAPLQDGSYRLDWASEFTALSEVLLEAPGRYAGLSVRMAKETMGWKFMDSENRENESIHGKKSAWVAASGNLGQGVHGIAVMSHPSNERNPSPWYLAKGMPYFSPAFLFDGDCKIAKGKTLVLKYRVVVHKGSTDKAMLDNAFKNFAAGK